MDNNVSSLVPGGDVGLNLNEDKSNRLNEVNKEVGLAGIKPSKQLAKWTRLNRMEDGPTDLNKSTNKPMLGKRLLEDVLDVNWIDEDATLSEKHSRVVFSDGVSEVTSAGVEDHPCREQ